LSAFADSSAIELEVASTRQHITADRTLYHSNDKVYEAFGHVVVSARGQRLSSDYAWMDTVTGELRARGNVVLVTPTSIVTAAELHYNLATKFGTIFYGRVTSDQYTLKGQLIRKVSDNRFLTTDGEYTTCLDCPESWKIAAKSVDLTFEGYAFMDSAFITIKDTPTLYVPYMVLPVKRKRQTGLLFPRIGSGEANGFVYVQPFFWAIDDHQDLTLSYGTYSKRGRRAELEYRYKSYGEVGGTLNTYYVKDRTFENVRLHRYAIQTTNNWSLVDPVKIKWRVAEVSDHDYIRILGDLPMANLSYLESGALVNVPNDQFFASAEVKRYRNMISNHEFNFDGGMVQAVPSVYFGAKERKIGPFSLNMYGRLDNYQRVNGGYDDQNDNQKFEPTNAETENIRETQRLILTPTIATSVRVGRVWSLAPSLEFNQMNYNFNLPQTNSNISQTQRRYLVGRLETSTELEKIYPINSETVSAVKHQIIPKITYTHIPWEQEDVNHPFSKQIQKRGGAFDQFDIVPKTNSTNFMRLPLGNSVSYGFTSRLIRKNKPEDEIPKAFPYDVRKVEIKKYESPQNKKQEIGLERSRSWDSFGPRYNLYETFWDLSVDQAYDFIEESAQRRKERTEDKDTKRAFSRMLAVSSLSLFKFSNRTEYTYYPRLIEPAADLDPTKENVSHNVQQLNTSFSWSFINLVNSRGTLYFRRALSVSYSNYNLPTATREVRSSLFWSLNDFFSTEYSQGLDFLKRSPNKPFRSLNQNVRLIYNSPSECWQIGIRYSRSYDRAREYALDFGLNLFGVGYTGVNQISQQSSAVGVTPLNLGPLGGGAL
jgi:lipopolysaccharide assembly outer membrane protein LptD (OstA)